MIKWFGTGCSIIGAFLVASGIFVTGYIFFIAGTILWGLVAYQSKDNALLLLQIVFGCADTLGLINFWG